MKKTILFLFILSAAVFSASTQILPDWTWAKAIGGSQATYVQNVLMDNAGNMYISGSANSSLKVDGAIMSTDTNSSVFVAKFNSAGKLLWKASLMKVDPQSPGFLSAESILLDKDNNLYFTVGASGNYSGDTFQVVLNTDKQYAFTFIAHGFNEQPASIIKLDPDGNFKYRAEITGYGNMGGKKNGKGKKGGSQNLSINGSAVDKNGNLFIAGSFRLDSFRLGNIYFYNNQQYQNSFVAKIDSGGNFDWVTIDSTTVPNYFSGAEANTIAIDASGDPIIGGTFTSSDRKFGSFTTTMNGNTDNFYLVSLDRVTGNPKNLVGSGGNQNDFATSIINDPDGNFYLSGFTSSSTIFGQATSGTQLFEVFLSKIDSLLNPLWTKVINTELGSISSADILPVVYGPDKSPVITGFFETKTLSLDAFNVSNHDTLPASGTKDYFIAKFDPNGTTKYLSSAGTRMDDNYYGPNFNVYSDVHNMVTLIAPLMDTAFFVASDTVKTPVGIAGFVIAHIDTAGKSLGAKPFLTDPAQPYTVLSNNIVQSYSGYIGVAGTFTSPNILVGSNLLTAQDSLYYYDVFISRMAYSMAGTILDQSNQPVNAGYIKLFVLAQSGPAMLIDSAQLTITGNYKFTDAPLTGSLLYAAADTGKYQYYVGTYSGNSMLWTGATFLDLVTSPPSAFNITLKQVLPVFGPGIISGTVSETLTDTVASVKKLKLTGRPMKGASVVLVGKSTKGSDTIIAIAYTDAKGFYQFANIPVGDYKVWMDVTGLGMLQYYAVSVSALAPEIANANYIVSDAGIYKDPINTVKNIKSTISEVLIYPNPATDYIHVIIPMKAATMGRIEIYSVGGRLLNSLKLDSSTSGSIILNTSNLASGMYILKASFDGKAPVYGNFVKQ